MTEEPARTRRKHPYQPKRDPLGGAGARRLTRRSQKIWDKLTERQQKHVRQAREDLLADAERQGETVEVDLNVLLIGYTVGWTDGFRDGCESTDEEYRDAYDWYD